MRIMIEQRKNSGDDDDVIETGIDLEDYDETL